MVDTKAELCVVWARYLWNMGTRGMWHAVYRAFGALLGMIPPRSLLAVRGLHTSRTTFFNERFVFGVHLPQLVILRCSRIRGWGADIKKNMSVVWFAIRSFAALVSTIKNKIKYWRCGRFRLRYSVAVQKWECCRRCLTPNKYIEHCCWRWIQIRIVWQCMEGGWWNLIQSYLFKTITNFYTWGRQYQKIVVLAQEYTMHGAFRTSMKIRIVAVKKTNLHQWLHTRLALDRQGGFQPINLHYFPRPLWSDRVACNIKLRETFNRQICIIYRARFRLMRETAWFCYGSKTRL